MGGHFQTSLRVVVRSAFERTSSAKPTQVRKVPSGYMLNRITDQTIAAVIEQ
jgi:hypothetical protein